MTNDIIVSEMTSATQINTNDLMIMTQPDLQAETGYSTKKGTVLQVANKMLKGTEYLTDLPDFTDKTVLGGLEELKGDLTALLPVDTASGAIANFDTDLSLPLVDCKASIVASQASGTPTPSSPLAISGYTGVNLIVCGENLFDKTTVTSGYLINGSGNQVTYTGWNISDFIPVPEGGSLYLNGLTIHPNSNQDNFMLFDENKTKIGYANVLTSQYPWVIPTGTKYVKFSLNDSDLNTAQLSPTTGTSGTYATPVVYAVSWQDEAGTVYGGNLDLTTGLLTVTHGEIDSYNGESINEPWLSSKDVYTEGGTPTTGAQVVYPLTTPVTYQLSATQINALLGVNNIYNDTNGDTEVKYKEGIQHYIDKKIAATQALIL